MNESLFDSVCSFRSNVAKRLWTVYCKIEQECGALPRQSSRPVFKGECLKLCLDQEKGDKIIVQPDFIQQTLSMVLVKL